VQQRQPPTHYNTLAPHRPIKRERDELTLPDEHPPEPALHPLLPRLLELHADLAGRGGPLLDVGPPEVERLAARDEDLVPRAVAREGEVLAEEEADDGLYLRRDEDERCVWVYTVSWFVGLLVGVR
jgi:hypothetical protein